MSIYVKVKNTEYPATVDGVNNDRTWNGRDTKTVTLTMTHADAAALFVDGLAWSIVFQGDTYTDPETGETVTPAVEEYDNSDYSVAGPITDNRDGTVSVKMGKPTQLEMMQAQLANAVTQAELETAYTEGVNSL